ncbi:MAG: phage antirepressor KilAC domain-containing protein [Thiopseudomonas sp.]|nr:phage antirepressor KilAC domain-containing protein [Thiopseudomonas sp.]
MRTNELLSKTANNATMSSQQIAELVGSRHDSVKRAIERLGTQRKLKQPPVIQLPPLVEVKNHLGQTVLEYIFSGQQGERDSYVVVAQLSPEFTAKLVDEWKRLKNGNSIPQTYATALLEAGRLAQLAEQQAAQLALAAPKVEFVDKYVAADSGSKGFRQVAKLLKASERDFREFLNTKKVMYKLGGEWMPYQHHTEAGRFEVKAGVAGEHAFNQAMFTAKGVSWIAGLWAQHQLEVAA